MADGGPILDSKKNVTVNGRVSPVNGQYYSGVTVELIQIKDNTEYVCGSGVTDSNGYYNFTGRVYYIGGFGELYTRVEKDHSNSINLDKIGLEFTVNDSFETYSNTPFVSNNILIVDYGDSSTLDTYSTGKLSHTYASSGNYDVKLYGNITGISDNAFRNCTSLISITIPEGVTSIGESCFRGTHLESITIPESVTSLGDSCFDQCSHLMYIHLNWDSADTIVNYNSTWLGNTTGNFYIPKDTTSLYIAKGYPSNKLIEDYSPFDGITVSSDKDILSYADGDSATVSAQLTSGGQPVSISDEVVVFEFVKASDDSVVVTLMGTTDNTGLASVSYLGNGVGDLNITVRCRSVIETYSIEDCYKYGIKSTDTWHNITASNTGTYSNGEYKGYNKALDFDFDISSNWELSVDYKKEGYRNGIIILEKTITSLVDKNRYAFLWEYEGNRAIFEAKDSNGTLLIDSQVQKTMNYNQYYNIKIVKQGTSIKTYVDDVQVHSETYVDVGITNANVGLFAWGDSPVGYLKNLKIKPL